jgi:hypothetical protein
MFFLDLFGITWHNQRFCGFGVALGEADLNVEKRRHITI